MQIFEGIADAADQIREFFLTNKAGFPGHVRDRIEGATRTGSSPVDLIVTFTKAVYANRDDVPADALPLAAGAADLIDQQGYHGRLDETASSVSLALRRDSGETLPGARKFPKKEDDPQPDSAMLPPQEEIASPLSPGKPTAEDPGK